MAHVALVQEGFELQTERVQRMLEQGCEVRFAR